MKKTKMYGLIAAFSLLLTGCGGIEPENRSYPLAIIADYDKGSDEFQMEFSMADLAEKTGQGKDDKGEASDKEREELTYAAKSPEKIEEMHRKSQEKFLDLGHVKAVFLGPGLLGEKEKLGELLAYFQKQPALGMNAAVFSCSDPPALIKIGESLPDSLGEYLTGLYENYPEDRRWTPVTLGEVFYHWYDRGELLRLPLVMTDGEKIILEA